ncbi:MAG TPA: hypothetical protein VKN99_19505 [Polyangia bacterium]|nr:hypothetical protein [Polyangia bacterium]
MFERSRVLGARPIGLAILFPTASALLSWYNEWSGLCEVELGRLGPGHPPAAEMRVQPGFVATRVDEGRLVENAE